MNRIQDVGQKLKGCPAVAGLCLVVTALCLIRPLSGFVFGISPTILFVKGYAWTIVTAALVETNVVNYVSSLYGLISLGMMVEPTYGVRKMLEFFLVVGAVSNIVLTFSILFWWRITDNFMEINEACGASSLVGGLAVVIKQLIPENHFRIPPLFGSTTVRGANFPHLYVGSVMAWHLVGGLLTGRWSPVFFEPLKMLLGVLVAWAYLRHYQRRDGRAGDTSDVFAFVTFFPDNAQPTIAKWLRVIEEQKLRLRDKLGMPVPRHQVREAYKETTLTDADTTRHRNIGLELLEQQMSITKTAETGSSPSTTPVETPRVDAPVPLNPGTRASIITGPDAV